MSPPTPIPNHFDDPRFGTAWDWFEKVLRRNQPAHLTGPWTSRLERRAEAFVKYQASLAVQHNPRILLDRTYDQALSSTLYELVGTLEQLDEAWLSWQVEHYLEAQP